MNRFVTKRQVLLLIPILLLSACDLSGSIFTKTNSGVELTVSGAVKAVQDGVNSIKEVGSDVAKTAKDTKENIDNRVDSVQKGVQMIKEGKE
ncbi:hypothetical protein HN960_04235, partial [Candidatus Peregrinibacteria bacterium]|nr:hypothetical protein [Candidatus Peregrinibacteria bacterium]